MVDTVHGRTGSAPSIRTHPPATLAVLVCTLVTVMEGYSLIVYGAVVPLLLQDSGLGLTPDLAGLVGGLIYVGMFFGALAAGIIGDRVGRQPVLLVATALFGLGLAAAGLSGTVAALGAARLFSGLGVGGAVVTALSLSRNHAPAHRSSLVVNITMAGIPIGGTIAAFVGLWIMPRFGWRPMFFFGAALTLVILCVVAVVRLEQRHELLAARRAAPATRHGSLRALFSGRGTLYAILAAAVAIPNMFTWFGLNVWLVATMSALQYPLTSALTFSLTLTGGAIIGSLSTAVWADRWGVFKVGIVTTASTVVGLAGVIVVGRSIAVLLVCIFLMGAGGHSTMNLLNAGVSNLFPAAIRGTTIGWTNGMSYFGALGPALGGVVLASAAGPYGVFVLYGVSALLALLVMTLLAARAATEPGHPDMA